MILRHWNSVLARLALAFAVFLAAPAAWTQEERLDSLTIDGNTFSNVTVISRTGTHISFRHAHGFASVKLSALPASDQSKVGYTPPPPPRTLMQRAHDYTAWLHDPRVKALEADIRGEINRIQAQNDTTLIYPALGGAVCIYFLFCLAVVKICQKTTVRPGLAAWLPGLQFISLLKAAGMSPWLYLLIYVPPVNIVIMVMWCFKICRTRQKPQALAFLLMPWMIPINVFVFFYLAFSAQKKAQATRQQPLKLKLSFQS